MRAIVSPRPGGAAHEALMLLGRLALRCAVGERGIAAEKEEGDHATPSGVLALRHVLYRADRVAPFSAAVAREPVARSDGWCDDPADASYNRRVTLPHAGRAEHLWRDDGLYDIVGVLGWNDRPVVRGRGSAIFVHVATPDFGPTQGCVALAERDLIRVLEAGLTEIEISDGPAP